jgi:protein-L-isoaspartate(D-aspartate) O-methyltransferase
MGTERDGAVRGDGKARGSGVRRGAVGAIVAVVLALLTGCGMGSRSNGSDSYEAARLRMVETQLRARGIADPKVLRAMETVPRHELVPESLRDAAYDDRPLPIGAGQTISQPYIVAAMSEALALSGDERVLEIGTGSGYQAAVLAEMGVRVYSIELVPELAERARRDLTRLGYEGVEVRQGDGYRGWPEHAPFDAIIVTAAPEEVPPALVEQLAMGGRMAIPVGTYSQDLVLLRKRPEGIERRLLMPVRFVPMRSESE